MEKKKQSKEEMRRARKQDTKHKAVSTGALEPHSVKTGHWVQKLAKFIM